jgi:sulfur-oxidizing protein SoxY
VQFSSCSRCLSRRHVLIIATRSVGCLALAWIPKIEHADATPTSLQDAVRNVIGAAALHSGKVTLDLPPLVENGNTVSMVVSVQSPMTPEDYVKAIHVFNEKNPQPQIINAYLGWRAGRASISTRIRLADSQKVVAIAEMSDGTFWSASFDVIVTLAACVEELL